MSTLYLCGIFSIPSDVEYWKNSLSLVTHLVFHVHTWHFALCGRLSFPLRDISKCVTRLLKSRRSKKQDESCHMLSIAYYA